MSEYSYLQWSNNFIKRSAIGRGEIKFCNSGKFIIKPKSAQRPLINAFSVKNT